MQRNPFVSQTGQADLDHGSIRALVACSPTVRDGEGSAALLMLVNVLSAPDLLFGDQDRPRASHPAGWRRGAAFVCRSRAGHRARRVRSDL
jgi:hypothetical protein